MTLPRSRSLWHVLAIAAIVSACTDSGPRVLSVAGEWAGNSAFGGTQSPFTRMDLVQNGGAVSGTMRVTGAFAIAGLPITGTVDGETRTFEWQVFDGCEEWSGTLTVAADRSTMAGPIVVDRSGCPGSNSSGTLTLTRQ